MTDAAVTAHNQPPYFDDFNAVDEETGLSAFTKNYHRILFQPTNAVQARELNQLQTSLQNQIAQVGLSQINAYNGGQVIGGIPSIDATNVTYVDVKFDNPLTQSVENVFDAIKFIETRVWDSTTSTYIPDITAEVLSIRETADGNYRIWHRYSATGANASHFTSSDIIFILNDIIPDDQSTPISVVLGDPLIDGTDPDLVPYHTFDIEDDGVYGYRAIATVIPKYDESGTTEIPAVGYGFNISVAEGVFFVKGCFVHTFAQSYYYVLTNATETVDGFVSFMINETITTVAQDATLRDNANGTYNFAAPGADRYTITLTLALNTTDAEVLALNSGINPIFNSKASSAAAIQYINLLEIIDSAAKLVAVPQSLSDDLRAERAKRTKEESGNYTITPFQISIREFLDDGTSGGVYTMAQTLQNNPLNIKDLYLQDTELSVFEYDYSDEETADLTLFTNFLNTKLVIAIDPAVAYVDGYRVQPAATRTVLLDKARTMQVTSDMNISMSRGNYLDFVISDEPATHSDLADIFAAGGFGTHIKNIAFLGLVSASDVSYERYPAEQEGFLKFRVYIYGDFSTANPLHKPTEMIYKTLEATVGSGAPIPDKVIKYPKEDTSVYSLLHPAVYSVTNVEYAIQKYFTPVANVGTKVTFTLGVNDGAFLSGITKLDLVLFNTTTSRYVNTLDVIDDIQFPDSKTMDIILTDPQGDLFSVMAPVQISDGSGKFRKGKVITSRPATTVHGNCSTRMFTLPDQDVLLDTLVVTATDPYVGTVPVNYTVVYDGLGKNFYENPVIRVTSAMEPAEGGDPGEPIFDVTVSYDYFEHNDGSSGQYFSANSYRYIEDALAYEDVPKFGNGRLTDFLDFRVKRSRVYDAATDAFTYVHTLVPTQLLPNAIAEVTLQHYLGRIDTLSITSSGDFIVAKGVPSLDPFPTKEGANMNGFMNLYQLTVKPYTYNPQDVGKGYIDNNRYTMRDIGRLEKRISNLEYYSSLSLLEKEAKDRKILDLSSGGGIERFKNGTLVDSFIGHNVGDISDAEYAAAVNTKLQTMGPSFLARNHRLRYTGLVHYPNTTGDPWQRLVTLDPDLATNYLESGSTIDGIIKTAPTITGIAPGLAGREIISLWHGQREILYENLLASQTISVQPFEVTTWAGRVALSPSADEWIDTDNRPAFNVDFSSFENYFEDVSNNIVDLYGVNETLLTDSIVGRTVGQTSTAGVRWTGEEQFHGGKGQQQNAITTTTTTAYQATVAQDFLQTNVQNVDINFGDRIVDMSIVPWIRSRDVLFRASGFKPGTTLYAFFDGQNVTDHCMQIDPAEFIPNSLNAVATTYPDESPADWPSAYNWGVLVTDSQGVAAGSFRIPNREGLRFRTGNRIFKLIDNQFNNELEADTFGSTQYHASGLLQAREQIGSSVRIPNLEVGASERIIRWEDTSVATELGSIFDPIAQTFAIRNEYPNGMFLSDIDIYIATRPDDDNIPITVYLVPCENGIPTKEIVPGSEVSIRAGDLTRVSGRDMVQGPDGSVEQGGPVDEAITNFPTRFTFDYPVYLKAGDEYAVVVFSTSPEYRVWTSVLSGVDLSTNQIITRNASFGVLLKSQNKSTWTPDQYRDLTCRLHKAVFPVNQTYQCRFSTFIKPQGDPYPIPIVDVIGIGDTQSVEAYEHTFFQLFVKTMEPAGTDLLYEVNYADAFGALMNSSGLFLVKGGNENHLASQIDNPHCITADARLITSDRHVSPVIDCETGSVATRENVINNLSTNEGGVYNPITNMWSAGVVAGGSAMARYITKSVTLNNASEDLRVVLAVNRPSVACGIEVYARQKTTEAYERSLSELKWYRMGLYTVAGDENATEIPINSSRNDYTEVEYVLPMSDPNIPLPPGMFIDDAYGYPIGFTEFSVKVVFLSSDKAKVCKIKNLTAIASI